MCARWFLKKYDYHDWHSRSLFYEYNLLFHALIIDATQLCWPLHFVALLLISAMRARDPFLIFLIQPYRAHRDLILIIAIDLSLQREIFQLLQQLFRASCEILKSYDLMQLLLP